MLMTSLTFEDFLPQGEEIQKLQSQIQSDRMVHALLLTGEKGTGKRSLALIIAAGLLCKDTDVRPCMRCGGCHRALHDDHPDLVRVGKDTPLVNDAKKNRSTIPIDDIREMIRVCGAYTAEGGNRIILIEHAEDMTTQAQNCLLKILEEPPLGTYFILTSNHPEQLLVTVRSRCRMLKLRPWDDQYVTEVLVKDGENPDRARMSAYAAHGSIGQAKKIASDEQYWKMKEEILTSFFSGMERSQIVIRAAAWKDFKGTADEVFDMVENCIGLLLRCRMEQGKEELLKGFSPEWKRFALTADYSRFVYLLDRVREARKRFKANVSIQAIAEQLMLDIMGEV